MRCNDCNKFVSFADDTEPEAEIEIDEDGQISGTVRIVLTCADCGTELKESNFDVCEEVDIDGHHNVSVSIEETADHRWMVLVDGVQTGGERDASGAGNLTFATREEAEHWWSLAELVGHELSVEVDSVELISRSETVDKKGKRIPARYAKTFYGYSLDFSVSCSCGGDIDGGTLTDECQASAMDEC